MKTLIVSRFNESLDWLSLVVDWEIIIYNKGSSINRESTTLTNVGREAETYLNFIVNNYDQLNGLYGFIQGDPFGAGLSSNPSIIDDINSVEGVDGFSFFKNSNLLNSDMSGLPDHDTGIDIRGYCNKFKIKVPELLTFSPGAQFLVTDTNIKNRPLDFYKSLLDSVNKTIKPAESYILERLWFYIFNPPKE